MLIADILKKNRSIYKLGRKLRLAYEEINRNYTGWYSKQRALNAGSGIKLANFGGFNLKLNENISYERRLLFDKSEELNWLHSIKMLLSERSVVLFLEPLSLLVPIFLARNVGCRVFVISKNADLLKSTTDEENVKGLSFVSEFSELMQVDLLFVTSSDDLKKINFLQAVFIGENLPEGMKDVFNIYKNQDGRLFKIDHPGTEHFRVDYFLFQAVPRPIFAIHTKDASKKISGATYLRSPEIYPFDLCYASVLDIVDEFVFGIDEVLQIDTEEEHKKRDQFLERFMDGLTESQRKKIRFEEFDFCERFNRNLNVPAKWLVDVSNSLLDRSRFENICFIQADEMYHEDNHDQILRFAYQNKIQSLNHEFLHFMFDLNHIRNPATVAYTHACRVFKRDRYSCTGDGYTFIPIQGKNYLPIAQISKFPIYHLGYVIDFRKKMEAHLSQGGLFDFKNHTVDKDKWIYKADVVNYAGSLPSYLFQKNKISSEKIEPFIKNLKLIHE